MILEISKCVYGKDGKYCTECKVQKYCVEDCQEKDLQKYFREHIKKNWSQMIKFVINVFKYEIEKSGHDYIIRHFVTCVKDSQTVPNVKYWTFALITTKKYPKTINMFFSDHEDGVVKKFDHYDCIHENILYSEDDNPFSDDIGIRCFKVKASEHYTYFYIDWNTGEIYRDDKLDENNLR